MRFWNHNPRRTSRMAGLSLSCLIPILANGACKDEIPPPPPEEAAETPAAPSIKPIALDTAHSITFKADRTITIPNLLLVVQNDVASPTTFGITLTCSKPTTEGARALFGSIESAESLEVLFKDPIRYASGTTLDPTGNGVFTITSVYHPKFVEMRISSFNDHEAAGKLTGEFYRFSLATPLAKPTVIKAEAVFSALVLRK